MNLSCQDSPSLREGRQNLVVQGGLLCPVLLIRLSLQSLQVDPVLLFRPENLENLVTQWVLEPQAALEVLE